MLTRLTTPVLRCVLTAVLLTIGVQNAIAGDDKQPYTLPSSQRDKALYQPEYSNLKERLLNVWESPNWHIIIPVHTWHSRWTYTKQKGREYNEMPGGFGFGKWYRDMRNWPPEFSFIVLAVSYSYAEPLAGYPGHKDIFLDKAQNWSFGYGAHFFLTARHNYSYVPIPGIIPHIALQYKHLALNIAWVPYLGGEDGAGGDVFFTQVRWYF